MQDDCQATTPEPGTPIPVQEKEWWYLDWVIPVKCTVYMLAVMSLTLLAGMQVQKWPMKEVATIVVVLGGCVLATIGSLALQRVCVIDSMEDKKR